MEEEETTKRLDTIDDIEENEEVDLDEVTKENTVMEEVDDDSKVEEDTKQEPIEKKTKDKESKKKKSKKKIIIIIIVIAIIIIGLIVFLAIRNNDKDKTYEKISKSDFINTINKDLKNGNLAKEMNKALEDVSLDVDKVYLISLDIDSDKKQELVAYASSDDENYLLNFDVDEVVSYEESYKLDSKESLFYTYSLLDNKAYWVTLNKDNYAIISDTVKIINKEEYTNNYYEITKKYDDEIILNNAIKYNLGKKLDIKELEDNQITNKGLLKDNNLTLDGIKDKAIKYQDELKKQEEEKANKEKQEKEEAAKKKMEEDAKKQSPSSLNIGSYVYKFGTYNIINPDKTSAGVLVLNSDYTCVHKEKACTYSVDEKIDVSDESGKEIITSGIVLSDGTKYIITNKTNQFSDLSGLVIVKYKE